MTTRQRTIIQRRQNYKNVLCEQCLQHKHLIIAPFPLVLALPRLIIYSTGSCTISPSGSWLFLTGYLISFVPYMVTFVVFVFPSISYKQVFRKSIERYLRTIKISLHFNS
ncbi:unnamed protein product [Rotaria sp. Silwood2]|nr:unnamed protein product [Rotaria sp. Silwood2]CAF3124258.1 unnamed protein product [Rotaria sp. Silwood2]CAF4153694.1 unnamed protein product [Rotaria sp. Silwood2]CAF4258183.1 unnamed protein product [Rotaria sp. Silwood2]CAF4739557.1 unnamed protein product [Rotaria sp. Silwood2]